MAAAGLSAATQTHTENVAAARAPAPPHSTVWLDLANGQAACPQLRQRHACRAYPELNACEGTRTAWPHQPYLPAGPVPGCSLSAPLSPLASEGHGKQFDNCQRSRKVANTSLFCHLPKHSVQGKIPSTNTDAPVPRWHARSWLPCNELHKAPQGWKPTLTNRGQGLKPRTPDSHPDFEGPKEGHRALDSNAQQLASAPRSEAAAQSPGGQEQINYHLRGFAPAKKLLTTHSRWQWLRTPKVGERLETLAACYCLFSFPRLGKLICC